MQPEFLSELQYQLLPDSIWWQHTQHVAPPASLMQACGLSLLLPGNLELRSSDHPRPDSENENIQSHTAAESLRNNIVVSISLCDLVETCFSIHHVHLFLFFVTEQNMKGNA